MTLDPFLPSRIQFAWVVGRHTLLPAFASVRLRAARRRMANHQDGRPLARPGETPRSALPDRGRDRDRHRQPLDAADGAADRQALVLAAKYHPCLAGADRHPGCCRLGMPGALPPTGRGSFRRRFPVVPVVLSRHRNQHLADDRPLPFHAVEGGATTKHASIPLGRRALPTPRYSDVFGPVLLGVSGHGASEHRIPLRRTPRGGVPT